MGGNLAEFMKVLIIVVVMSSIILSFRSFMANFDEEEKEETDDSETGNKLPENDPAVQR